MLSETFKHAIKQAMLECPSVLYPIRFLSRTARSRAFHAFCVGAPKTGTHSVAKIFARHCRARHEPLGTHLVSILEREDFFTIRDGKYDNYFRARDDVLRLEMEASHLLGPFVGTLQRAFPDARFMVTVRDPRSWLDSMLNDQLNLQRHPDHDKWIGAYRYYFRAGHFHETRHDRPLVSRGLFPLEGYVSYWSANYSFLLDQLHPDQLLILQTHELATSGKIIAKFLEIPASSLDFTTPHAYQTTTKHHVLREVDSNYLEDLIARYCARLTPRLFPIMQPAS